VTQDGRPLAPTAAEELVKRILEEIAATRARRGPPWCHSLVGVRPGPPGEDLRQAPERGVRRGLAAGEVREDYPRALPHRKGSDVPGEVE